MIRLLRKRETFWFCLGGLMVACFAGPLAGLISASLTPSVAGGSTESGAARRILNGRYWRQFQEGDFYSKVDTDVASPCEERLDLSLDRDPANRPAIADLLFTIRREQASRLQKIEDRPVLTAVGHQAWPIRGALDGCLGRSLLSGFCGRYLDHVIEQAKATSAKEVASEQAESKRESSQMWCVAVGEAPARNQ